MTLWSREQVTEYFHVEERTERWSSGTRPKGWPPALIYIPRDTDAVKYVRVSLNYAAGHRLDVRAVTSDHEAVIAVAEHHLVEVVVAAVRWRGGHFDEVEVAIAASGIAIAFARETPGINHRRRISVDPVAARMAQLGIPADDIAQVLAIPLPQVWEMLGGRPDRPGLHNQRPQRRPDLRHR